MMKLFFWVCNITGYSESILKLLIKLKQPHVPINSCTQWCLITREGSTCIVKWRSKQYKMQLFITLSTNNVTKHTSMYVSYQLCEAGDVLL